MFLYVADTGSRLWLCVAVEAVVHSGQAMYKGYEIKYTDPGFWQVFSFRFVSGKPFTQADFDSAIPVAVVSESVARKLYGSTEVVGKSVIIDMAPIRFAGWWKMPAGLLIRLSRLFGCLIRPIGFFWPIR